MPGLRALLSQDSFSNPVPQVIWRRRGWYLRKIRKMVWMGLDGRDGIQRDRLWLDWGMATVRDQTRLLRVCMIFVIERTFICSLFKITWGWKWACYLVGRKVNGTFSLNVVCGTVMRGSTLVEAGGDVDLVALSLFHLFIHTKLIKPNFYLWNLHIPTSTYSLMEKKFIDHVIYSTSYLSFNKHFNRTSPTKLNSQNPNMHSTGSCYCRAIQYSFDVSPEEARASLCLCHNCKVLYLSNPQPPPPPFSQLADQHNRNSSAQITV